MTKNLPEDSADWTAWQKQVWTGKTKLNRAVFAKLDPTPGRSSMSAGTNDAGLNLARGLGLLDDLDDANGFLDVEWSKKFVSDLRDTDETRWSDRQTQAARRLLRTWGEHLYATGCRFEMSVCEAIQAATKFPRKRVR